MESMTGLLFLVCSWTGIGKAVTDGLVRKSFFMDADHGGNETLWVTGNWFGPRDLRSSLEFQPLVFNS